MGATSEPFSTERPAGASNISAVDPTFASDGTSPPAMRTVPDGNSVAVWRERDATGDPAGLHRAAIGS
jgi:hypothetical protein